MDQSNNSKRQHATMSEDMVKSTSTQTVIVNLIKYSCDDTTGEASVIDGKNIYGHDLTITIPKSITVAGKIYNVTSIGIVAFAGNKYIASVIIPDTVTRIGPAAFSGCTGMKSVTIPKSVKQIMENAFSQCIALERVNISDIPAWCNIDFEYSENGGFDSNPLKYAHNLYVAETLVTECIIPQGVPEGLRQIKQGTFYGCRCLKSLTIGNSPKFIGRYAFFGCSGLTSISIPNSVISVGSYAFSNCYGLTKVYIGISVNKIGSFAFLGCNGLESVHIMGLTEWCKIDFENSCSNPLQYAHNLYENDRLLKDLLIFPGIDRIRKYAFQGCSMTSVTIPTSATSIGEAAFAGCNGLTSLTIPDSVKSIGKSAFEGCSSLLDMIIGNSVITIGSYAFAYCIDLKSLAMGRSVESIGDYAFSDCISLNEVILSDISKWCQIEFGRESNPFHYGCDLMFKSNGGIRKMTQLNIPKGIDIIPSGVFSKCTSFSSVIIHPDVTQIGENAFEGCPNLNMVDFGNSHAAIGNCAFKNCSALKSLYFNNSDFQTVSIGNNAFEGCSGLRSLTLGKSVFSIGANAFAKCLNLNSLTIPPSVTSIGDFAFNGCSSLLRVDISDMKAWCNINFGVDANPLIYASFFYLRGGQESELVMYLTIPDDVETIKSRAFQGYDMLYSVIISDCVTGIGSQAFEYCTSLAEVTLGKGVKVIEDSAFFGCSKMSKVKISDIEAWCDIDFGEDSNPLKYGRYLYDGETELKDLVIPDTVEQIRPRAFYNCRSISSVTIPESVEKIGEDAFFQCVNLNSVYTTGVEAWCKIQFGYSGEGDYESNPLIYAHNLKLIGGENPIEILPISKNITRILQGSFCGCRCLKSVSFLNSVLAIEDYAFAGCSGLTSIEIPSSVKTVGRYAFSECIGLTKVTVGQSVSEIGSFAFYGCTSLKEVNVYGIREWIDIKFWGLHSNPLEYAHNFYLKNSLVADLVIPGNPKSISPRAFLGCSGIKSVTIPGSVSEIGSQSFEGCSGLNDVVIPDSVTIIHNQAFKYCSGLKTVTIGKSVKSIGMGAFDFCTNLAEVHISDLKAWCNIDFGANPLEITHSLYLNGEKIINLVIPGDVTTINNNSFRGCSSVESLAFAKSTNTNNGNVSEDHGGLESMTSQYSVKTIGANAFYGCKGLKSVTLPDSVESIGDNAFSGCTGLESITFPDSTIAIGENAFSGCNGLTKMIIGNGVKEIGSGAFKGCSKSVQIIFEDVDILSFCNSKFEYPYSNPLELSHWMFKPGKNDKLESISNLVIPKGVSAIQPGMFAECYSLIKLTIPDYTPVNTDKDSNADNPIPEEGSESVSIIGENAFLNCYKLETVTIGDSVKTIEAGAFQGCAQLGKLTIGKSVMKIGFGAFFNCAMTSVTIPESVMRIEGLAFYCKDLTEIRCMNRFPIPISENVFKNYDATLEVPSGSKKFYSEDKVWGKFANIKEPDPPESDKPEETTTPSENPES